MYALLETDIATRKLHTGVLLDLSLKSALPHAREDLGFVALSLTPKEGRLEGSFHSMGNKVGKDVNVGDAVQQGFLTKKSAWLKVAKNQLHRCNSHMVPNPITRSGVNGIFSS